MVDLLDYIKSVRNTPKNIRCDNGPEFVAKVLDQWAYESKVRLDFFNVNWFLSLEDARDKIEAWRMEYNEYHPHSSLEYKTPSDFAKLGLFN